MKKDTSFQLLPSTTASCHIPYCSGGFPYTEEQLEAAMSCNTGEIPIVVKKIQAIAANDRPNLSEI